jgi:hypothetical protein
MAYCDKGHWYDANTSTKCPTCMQIGGLSPGTSAESGAESKPGGALATQYEGDYGPPAPVQPLKPFVQGGHIGGAAASPAMPQGGGHMAPAGGTVLLGDEEAAERVMGFVVVTAAREDDEHVYTRLKKGVNTIGRFGSRSSIELRDRECSQQHALIICTNTATRLVDLDSSNGTKINGDACEIAQLAEGDRISVGRTDFVYVPQPYVAED